MRVSIVIVEIDRLFRRLAIPALAAAGQAQSAA
jgi:hypothetical protein